MLNAVMVSFCGGWSFLPPVVLASRLAATTRAPMAQCLAAGFCAAGPLHASAIEDAMRMYVQEEDVGVYAQRTLDAGGRIPGFGHPAVKKDPRPQALRRLADRYGVAGEAVGEFDHLCGLVNRRKGIHPNVDGINGAILVDLGFRDPAFGPAAFMIGRAVGLAAHVVEEYGKDPYYIMSPMNASFGQVRYAGFGERGPPQGVGETAEERGSDAPRAAAPPATEGVVPVRTEAMPAHAQKAGEDRPEIREGAGAPPARQAIPR